MNFFTEPDLAYSFVNKNFGYKIKPHHPDQVVGLTCNKKNSTG